MKQLHRLFALFLCFTLMIGFVSQPSKSIIEVKEIHTEHIGSSKTFREEIDKRLKLPNPGKKIIEPVTRVMVVDDELNIVSVGTGFSIKYDRKTDTSYVLTNEHICANYEEGFAVAAISSRNHSATIKYNDYDAVLKILYQDPTHDLCLLERPGKTRPVKFTDDIPAQTDKLTVVGAPHGNFPIVIESIFSGYIDRHEVFPDMIGPGYNYLLLSEIFHSGVSGSPVFNEKDEVVGIMFGSLGEWNGIMRVTSYGGLAVQTAEIKHFLEENNFEL